MTVVLTFENFLQLSSCDLLMYYCGIGNVSFGCQGFIDALAVFKWVAKDELGAKADVWNFLTVVSLKRSTIYAGNQWTIIMPSAMLKELSGMSSVLRPMFEIFSQLCH